MSQIKKGALLNYITIFLTNAVGLLLTPYMIRKMGSNEFGLYTLIGALIGYISVLDFGLGHTIIRFVAKYRAEKDKEGEENFLATTMLIYFFISFLVVIIGVICYFNLETIFKSSLNLEEIGKAKIMFIFMIFSLAIGLPGGIFNGICLGYEHFVYPKSIKIVQYTSRSIMLVAVLFYGGKALSVVIMDTIVNIIFIAIDMLYVFKNLKVKFKLHHFEKVLVKEIFSYSIWIFVFIIVAQFQWRTGQMVMGIIADTTVVAIYAVGIMLGGYYGAFSSAITNVFLPRAMQMTVANVNSEELTSMMIKIGRISFIVLIYILGAFFLYGKQFVFLWVGVKYYDAYIIALMIMFAYTIPLVQGFANAILEARKKMSFKAIIFLIFLLFGTILGYFLAKKYGPLGMITGTVVGWVIAQNIMNYYYYKVIKLNILRFFKELFNKTIISLFFVIIIGFVINIIPGENWFNFIIKAILYSIVFAIVFYYFAINKYEKELINNSFIKKIFKKYM
ncbi:MAG: oligosaccharide flippase family protein [Flavobacteriaceae bacterium]|nr:oligosaccharide flippase family protein [Flavobacteriaceae bacterium]